VYRMTKSTFRHNTSNGLDRHFRTCLSNGSIVGGGLCIVEVSGFDLGEDLFVGIGDP